LRTAENFSGHGVVLNAESEHERVQSFGDTRFLAWPVDFLGFASKVLLSVHDFEQQID
jgi:hypothetical protein